MAKTRRAYTGGAVSTTTTSSIAASGTTSFTITAGTGWPYGSDPFYVVVEPGTASEEKILVTRTGVSDLTINIASDSVRGLDGTAAVSHGSGVTVFPVFTAVDADEANELASKWSAKGDLVSYGSSTFEKLGVGTNGQFLRAASAEASGLKWESYTNTLGSGSAVRTLGTFVGGEVLQAAELNQLNNVTALRDTATLSIATTTVTAINYGAGTEIVDASGWHSTATNTDRVTPTIAGVYLVIAYGSVETAAFGANSRLYVAITKNNTLHTNANVGSPSYPAASCSAIIDLNGTTDWVNMQIFQDSGNTLDSVRRAFTVMLLRKS